MKFDKKQQQNAKQDQQVKLKCVKSKIEKEYVQETCLNFELSYSCLGLSGKIFLCVLNFSGRRDTFKMKFLNFYSLFNSVY